MTIEEQLAAKAAQLTELQGVSEKLAALEKEHAATASELSALKQSADQAAAAHAAAISAKDAEISRLHAEAKTAEQRAADILVKTGTDPLEIKPGASASSREELLMAFHSETDPKKKAEIYVKLNPSR